MESSNIPLTTSTGKSSSSSNSSSTLSNHKEQEKKKLNTYPYSQQKDLFQLPPLPSSSLSLSSTNTLKNTSIDSSAFSSNSILIKENQTLNPLIQFFTFIKYDVSSTLIPDYQISPTTAIFFLSLKYHRLHPSYIFHRTSTSKNLFQLRVLLLLIDVEDYQSSLIELTKFGLSNRLSLIIAKTFEECAKYIELYKSNDGKSIDALASKKASFSLLDQQIKFLTQIQGINKTDALTLLTNFKNIKGIAEASVSQLVLCPGFGTKKANYIKSVFNKPFLKGKPKVS